jgi:hypothetical protein
MLSFKAVGNPSVTSGGYSPNHNTVFFFNSDFIIPHLILTPFSLSPSCRRPVPLQEGPLGNESAYSIKAKDYETKPLFVYSKENRLLNELFLYVLEDLHTSQSLGALQFTSADPAFVKETVERVYPVQVQRRQDFRRPYFLR